MIDRLRLAFTLFWAALGGRLSWSQRPPQPMIERDDAYYGNDPFERNNC